MSKLTFCSSDFLNEWLHFREGENPHVSSDEAAFVYDVMHDSDIINDLSVANDNEKEECRHQS